MAHHVDHTAALLRAATPICNALSSQNLAGVGYDQSANVALGVAAQTAAAQTAIASCYIWVETVALLSAEFCSSSSRSRKNLPAEQAALKERNEARRPRQSARRPRRRQLNRPSAT